MKKILLLLSLLSFIHFAQNENLSPLLSNTIYNTASDEIKKTKAFSREWTFFEERAFPNNFIPKNAYANAYQQKKNLKIKNGNFREDITWVSLGPTPGYYFNYGNITSRIVTGAYHPYNPNIIYVGAANGGVWKTTNGGTFWFPLTDNQPSLSMGAIAIDPTNPEIIYAGTGEATYSGASYYGRGLLKSTDGGSTWTHYTSGLPSSSYFSRLIIKPGNSSVLLAALGNSGLYRSSDAGASWSQIIGGRIDDVKFSPSGDTAFVAGNGIGFRRSIDGGVTFQNFQTGLPDGTRTHFDLCRDNTAYMYAAVYHSSAVNVYKSSNFGVNWSNTTGSTDFSGSQAWYDLHIEVSPSNPNNVFVGCIDIFRTTDGGTSFQNITNGYSGGNVHVDQHFLFFHPTDHNTVVALNDGGVWRSTNNGSSFENLNTNLTLTQFYRITSSPFNPYRILGGTQDNGTQETHSTLNWAAAFGGDGGEVTFNPLNASYILGETQNGGLRRTTNSGSSWSSATSGITTNEGVTWVAPIIAHPTESGVFFTARTRVYKTTNNAQSWTAISSNVNGTTAVREMTISKTNPQLLYASSSNKVYRSDDGGATWTNVSTGLPSKTVTTVLVHPSQENIVYVTFSGFGGSKVYKSIDKGTTWISIAGDLPDSPVNDIWVTDRDATNPNSYFVATDVGVFLTRNDGQTWVDLDNGLPNTVIKHLDFSEPTGMLRAGTHGRGVYEAYIDFAVPVELASFAAKHNHHFVNLNWATSTETNNRGFEIERKMKNQEWITIGFKDGNGTTLEPINYSFADNIFSLNYTGKILYRLKQIDNDGTFKYSKMVSVDVISIPERTELEQNFPNPFNPNTTITFSLKDESFVTLKVYDLLGREIITLFNNELKVAGRYQTQFSTSQLNTRLASGIYTYVLTAKEANSNSSKTIVTSKKMILLN